MVHGTLVYKYLDGADYSYHYHEVASPSEHCSVDVT